MASGALSHDDGQYVADVSRRLIGQVCRRVGALRLSQDARHAPERGQQARWKKTRPFAVMEDECVHDYFGINHF
jgi:hypothetical protein